MTLAAIAGSATWLDPRGFPIDMSSQQTVRVINRQGLHARPADLLVRCATNFQSQILIHKGSESVDCRSILSLLTLGATEGAELVVTAEGADADEALHAVGELFESGFHELDDDPSPPVATSLGAATDQPPTGDPEPPTK